MTELKPCPFCKQYLHKKGGDDSHPTMQHPPPEYQATCLLDNYTVIGGEAVDMWNSRPVEEALHSEIDTLGAQYEGLLGTLGEQIGKYAALHNICKERNARIEGLKDLLIVADEEINDDPTRRGNEIHVQIKQVLKEQS